MVRGLWAGEDTLVIVRENSIHALFTKSQLSAKHFNSFPSIFYEESTFRSSVRKVNILNGLLTRFLDYLTKCC